jgi:uncharacterized protein with ParB-like and HNH nuclease domain
MIEEKTKENLELIPVKSIFLKKYKKVRICYSKRNPWKEEPRGTNLLSYLIRSLMESASGIQSLIVDPREEIFSLMILW